MRFSVHQKFVEKTEPNDNQERKPQVLFGWIDICRFAALPNCSNLLARKCVFLLHFRFKLIINDFYFLPNAEGRSAFLEAVLLQSRTVRPVNPDGSYCSSKGIFSSDGTSPFAQSHEDYGCSGTIPAHHAIGKAIHKMGLNCDFRLSKFLTIKKGQTA